APRPCSSPVLSPVCGCLAPCWRERAASRGGDSSSTTRLARSPGRQSSGASATCWRTAGRRSNDGLAARGSCCSPPLSSSAWRLCCGRGETPYDQGRAMITLASGLSYFDLEFERRPRIIATAVVHSSGGVALVDPGPSSTLPTLRATLGAAGISMRDVTTILLTHIHLDHAGATGTLVRQDPGLRVLVHEKGAPHMASPEKLMASATRLYGDAMDRLWGEMLPVPPEAMTVLRGGERISAGGRSFDVEYTPGHASHHVSF